MASQVLNPQPWTCFVLVMILNCCDTDDGDFGNLNQSLGIVMKLVMRSNKKSNGDADKVTAIGRKKKY